jgi:hypothetical protein
MSKIERELMNDIRISLGHRELLSELRYFMGTAKNAVTKLVRTRPRFTNNCRRLTDFQHKCKDRIQSSEEVTNLNFSEKYSESLSD